MDQAVPAVTLLVSNLLRDWPTAEVHELPLSIGAVSRGSRKQLLQSAIAASCGWLRSGQTIVSDARR